MLQDVFVMVERLKDRMKDSTEWGRKFVIDMLCQKKNQMKKNKEIAFSSYYHYSYHMDIMVISILSRPNEWMTVDAWEIILYLPVNFKMLWLFLGALPLQTLDENNI